MTAPGESPRRDRRARRHGRRGIVAGLIVVAALVGTGTTVAVDRYRAHEPWRDGSRHGAWRSAFAGYGTITATGSGAGRAITLAPARTANRNETHAALVTTARNYGDFVATVRVRTVAQLRQGAAGRPNPWEVGWVTWHYTSNDHFYALTLAPIGWTLSKQDPSHRGSERFLATGTSPRFPVGVDHTVGIVQIGNRITVSGDGHPLTQITDSQNPYLVGAVGLYTEDAKARFGPIHLNPLPDPRR